MANKKQREHKAKFWQRIKNNPLYNLNTISNAEIAELAGDSDLKVQLANPKFKDWFMDQDSNKSLLESGAETAIQKLIEIVSYGAADMGNGKLVKAGEQIKAAEIILKMAGYEPVKHKQIAYSDKDINEMDERQLEEFIKSRNAPVKSLS